MKRLLPDPTIFISVRGYNALLDQWFFIVTIVFLKRASCWVEYRPDEVLTMKFLVLTGGKKSFSFIHQCLFVQYTHTRRLLWRTIITRQWTDYSFTLKMTYKWPKWISFVPSTFLLYCLICNLEYSVYKHWFLFANFIFLFIVIVAVCSCQERFIRMWHWFSWCDVTFAFLK